MRLVREHRAATDELRAALDYYHAIDPELAFRLLEEFDSRVDFIRRHPEAPRLRRYNVRRVNLLRFPSLYIAYMIHSGNIVIIAFGHAKRRPYYWYRRPKDFRENY